MQRKGRRWEHPSEIHTDTRSCGFEKAVPLSAWNIWADVSNHTGTERRLSDAFSSSPLQAWAVHWAPGTDLIEAFGMNVGWGSVVTGQKVMILS